MGESEVELKSFLMKVESEKAGLKPNIQKTKIMALGPITSPQIDGETMETVTDFIFLGSKITADSDHSHEIKTPAPWRTAMTNLDSIKKQRHYFAEKGLHIQSYGFSNSYLQIWELDHKEGWAPKNWCFQTVVLEKTLESPLKDSQSILKEISPEYSMEGLMLKLQNFGHLMRIVTLIGKVPDDGKDWGQKEKTASEDVMAG